MFGWSAAAGNVETVCRTVSDVVLDETTKSKIFVSLCPTATEARELWKEPLALVLGIAVALPQHHFLGFGVVQNNLRSIWETTAQKLAVPFVPEKLAETGCHKSVIAVPWLEKNMCLGMLAEVRGQLKVLRLFVIFWKNKGLAVAARWWGKDDARSTYRPIFDWQWCFDHGHHFVEMQRWLSQIFSVSLTIDVG